MTPKMVDVPCFKPTNQPSMIVWGHNIFKISNFPTSFDQSERFILIQNWSVNIFYTTVYHSSIPSSWFSVYEVIITHCFWQRFFFTKPVLYLRFFTSIIANDHAKNLKCCSLLTAFLFERNFYSDMNQYSKFTDIFWHSSVIEIWTFSRGYS